MINPGARPLDVPDAEAARALAEQNLQAFLDEFTARGGELTDEPERDIAADAGGRYAWNLPTTAGVVPLLMPGVPLAELKSSSAQAPCLRVDQTWWWWNDAVGQVLPLRR